jgi:hypothetical protein
MIDRALDFLCEQLNSYLQNKLHLQAHERAIILSNISQLNETTPNSSGDDQDPQNAFLSLVNIEEDRISKSQETTVRKDNTFLYKNPRIFLNLYVLFAVNLSNYTDALQRLSLIIQFFQNKNVFTPNNSPAVDAKDSLNPPDRYPAIEQLVVDMYSLNFEQANQLWGTLGGRYIPSVLYKIRLVGIEEDTQDINAGIIKSITINN